MCNDLKPWISNASHQLGVPILVFSCQSDLHFSVQRSRLPSREAREGTSGLVGSELNVTQKVLQSMRRPCANRSSQRSLKRKPWLTIQTSTACHHICIDECHTLVLYKIGELTICSVRQPLFPGWFRYMARKALTTIVALRDTPTRC